MFFIQQTLDGYYFFKIDICRIAYYFAKARNAIHD